jgi:hypothetical protein
METNEAMKQTLLQLAESGVETLMTQLQNVQTGDLHALEQQILTQVFEVGRMWLEQILQQQGQRERAVARREGSCGHRQRLVGTRRRQVVTLLGPITIQRAYYQCMPRQEQGKEPVDTQCSHGEAPFDDHWGMGGPHSSPGVQKAVSYLSAHLTHAGTAEALSRLLPLHLSPRQVGNIIQPIDEALQDQEEQDVQAPLQRGASKRSSEAERQEERGEPIKRLYIEMDGVLARLRRDSVAMEPAEQERAGDVYREIKVGAVFVGEPGRERSALVPGVLVDTPGPIQYTARRTSAENFAPQLYALAHRVGLPRAKQVVILADGAKWIWGVAEEQFPGAIQIVDEYHARQHVWDVARAAFAAEPSQGDAWAGAVLAHLSAGHIEAVISAIEGLPPVAPAPGKTRSVPDIEADYFRRNAERMRYPVFRAQGMHVGSGIAEAACKTVVSTRAKRSGMRWTPQGLDAILALRTCVLNGSFDQRWLGIQEAA